MNNLPIPQSPQPSQQQQQQNEYTYLTTQDQVDQFYNRLIDDMSHCRDAYCPNLDEVYTNCIMMALQQHHPQIHREVDQCAALHGVGSQECERVNEHAMDLAVPIVDAALEAKFATLPGPRLEDYHPMEYLSPFWFEGAGQLWRRWTHQGLTREELYEQLVALEEMAESDETSAHHKLLLYPHAKMARAGLNCTALKPSLMMCLMYAGDIEAMGECFGKIPNIAECSSKDYFEPRPDGFFYGEPTIPTRLEDLPPLDLGDITSDTSNL